MQIGLNLTLRAINASARFSPASLFAAGEQGAWYDPSDLSTLFTDAAGTTPVTAVEQPVGLMLDKSKGLVLGSELVTNGDFSSGTTGWVVGTSNAGNTTLSVASGQLVVTALTYDSNANWAQQTFQTVAGKTYRASVDITASSGATDRLIRVGGGSITVFGGIIAGVSAVVGTNAFVFTATAATTNIAVGGVFPSGGSITTDNISVRELPGNHAFQSTAASRPVLSARVNLLTKTEDFGDAVWTENVAGSKASTTELDPNGNPTAVKINNAAGAGAGIRQATSFSWNGQTSLTVWLKSDGVNNSCAVILISGDSVVASLTVSDLTTSWKKYTVTASSASGTLSVSFQRTLGSGFYFVALPSLVPTNQASLPYQRVNTSTDYDTAGFPLYLALDGVDDWLQTNSIDFTSTDKMTVVAGVRKPVDPYIGATLLELSADSNANAGSFALFAPTFDNTNYGMRSRGSAVVNATVTPPSYPAPITNVLSGIGNISGDQAILRVNGTQAAISSADQGTGNYGNYPLYIGRRGGTSLSFNGRVYGLVVRGAASTAQQITQAESWMNQRTRAF